MKPQLKLEVENARAIISCPTRLLLETMKFLQKAVPAGKKKMQYNCEMTVKTNEVSFVVKGASKTVYCKASGPAKITVPFWYIKDIITNIKPYNTLILVSDGLMRIENTTFSVKTCFFHDDSILRSINLPINHSIRDILLLPTIYTNEEIEFNELDNMVLQANEEMERDICEMEEIMKKYGFSENEVDKLIRDRVFNKRLDSK